MVEKLPIFKRALELNVYVEEAVRGFALLAIFDW